MPYIPDYNDLLSKYEAEQQRKLERLPVCCYCDEPIQQETAICINDEWICDECIHFFRKDVETY